MIMIRQRALTVVVGKREYVFQTDEQDAPRSLRIEITVDGRSQWSSEEPGWRDLAVGVEDGASVYWWSARRLMAFENVEATKVHVIDADEDILRVFRTKVGWILVCETSVRLHANGQEVSRAELPDVVQEASWEEGVLVVRDDRGATVGISVDDRTLCVIS